MTLDYTYYFQSTNKFPFPELLEGLTAPHELLHRVKIYLKEKMPDGFIDPSAAIASTAVIRHPVYIGAGVEIGEHALVRPFSVIGSMASVGHGSEVKASIMFGGSKVASLSFVGDSILGASARIGSGVITANRRFDQGQVFIRTENGPVPVGSDYFGLIIGDKSRIGANCTTLPGTHIGRNTWIFPHTQVRGFIPSLKRVMSAAKLITTENTEIELKQ